MARPSPSWSRLDRQQERDVRELVRHVAGLRDEADPNFQLCLNFAWSNFRCEAWRWAGPGRGQTGSAGPWWPRGPVAGNTRLWRPAVRSAGRQSFGWAAPASRSAVPVAGRS